MSNTTGASQIPVRIGERRDFDTVREFLLLSGYTEEAVCDRTAIASIHDFRTREDGRSTGVDLRDALDLLIRLFLDVDSIEASVFTSMIPAECRDAMTRLGLVCALPAGVYSTVLLYPTEGFYCISDQTRVPPGLPPLGGDVVYPAVTKNTRTFLQFLPRTARTRVLEVCGGTGIAALAATRFAGHVWTADITARAAVFAQFNGLLNGLSNFTSVQGDMYAPVGDGTFDLIAAHPPYVPAASTSVIFRDGGADGEELVRRAIIEGVPRLSPGGILYLTCVASDRKDGRLEQRIRHLLGPLGAEIDILLLVRFEDDPVEYRVRSLLSVRAPLEGLNMYAEQARQLGITSLVYAHVYLRRRVGAAAVSTSRRRMGPATSTTEIQWALDMEAALSDSVVRDSLLDRRARVNPRSALLVRFGYKGGWIPAEATHSTEWPFTVAVRGPVWLSDLLLQCDGSVTLRSALAGFQASGLIDPAMTDAGLVTLVAALALNGTVSLEGLPRLPPAPEATVAGPVLDAG